MTGAAGGVGAHAVRALVGAGWSVHALDTRTEDAFPALHEAWCEGARERVRWFRADAASRRALGEAARGCEAVVHAAALVSLSEGAAAYRDANVRATRAVREAAEACGARHFVHIGCASIYRAGGGPVDEGAPVRPSNEYERSKWISERSVSGARAIGWTILRPAIVYGPYCRSMSAGIATLPTILRRYLPYLPSLAGGPRASWCHAADIGRAALWAIEHPELSGARVYNLADATPMSMGEVLTALVEALGLGVAAHLPFPSGAARAILERALARRILFGRARRVLDAQWRGVVERHGLAGELTPRLDANALGYATEDRVVDARAIREAGFVFAHDDLRSGLAEAVAWYQERHWLPRYEGGAVYEAAAAAERGALGWSDALAGRWEPARGGPEGSWRAELEAELRPAPSEAGGRMAGFVDGALTIDERSYEVRGTTRIEWSRARIIYEFGVVGAPEPIRRARIERALTGRARGEAIGPRGALAGRLVGGAPIGVRGLRWEHEARREGAGDER